MRVGLLRHEPTAGSETLGKPITKLPNNAPKSSENPTERTCGAKRVANHSRDARSSRRVAWKWSPRVLWGAPDGSRGELEASTGPLPGSPGAPPGPPGDAPGHPRTPWDLTPGHPGTSLGRPRGPGELPGMILGGPGSDFGSIWARFPGYIMELKWTL